VSSVEAPWPRRYERELREIYQDETFGPVEKSRELVEKVEDLGLQPYEAPDPLPQLEEEEEVKLVCWMAITPASVEDSEEDHPSLMSQVEVDTFGT
jgi:hypothetical protein